jgi:hypothetical protein
VGFPIEEPLRRRPVATVFSTVREEEERASDAPCRGAGRPKPLDTTRTASATPSSKEMGFTARSAFPRRVSARRLLSPAPRTRTRHRPRVLPPEPGFRRSFAPRYDEEELDPAAFTSSSPASARRHTPLVDFCNRNDPQARPANRRNPPRGLAPPAFAGSADAWNGSSAPFGATRPSCHGSGTGWDVRLSPRRPPAPLAALARSESLAPTRLARTPPVVDS